VNGAVLEAGLVTVDDVAAVLDELTEIDGVGKATKAQVEAALGAFEND
jgi:predicted flap endonuclease-1-like 5' DNA nuclease